MKGRFLLVFLALSVSGLSQTPSLESWASRLRAGHERLAAAESDEERLAQHDSLLVWWSAALDAGIARSSALEVLEGLCAMPEAGKNREWVKAISWNVELSDRTQRYGGFICADDGANGSAAGYTTTALTHDYKSGRWSGSARYAADRWPGAIYYGIVLTHHRKDAHYTLLGWDGGDALITRKLVEPLWVRRGKVRLGDRTLIGPDGPGNRLVLEFADDAVVALRYEEDAQRIVWDHLSPFESHLKGMTAFYGPDMTYDALVWRKGQWVYEPDVRVADPSLRGPFIAPPSRSRSRSRG